ncbi:Basic blue protein [Striga hermonthica]|uniref:Basic blue protein n=1 Tax=Striga hermonthica TaxID=68872 RepID=A0A9N7MDR4_STRHE|nr:Basic blue protein [Striga hermonthica]
MMLKVVLLLCVLLHWWPSPAHSKTYIVGGSSGWSYHVSGWVDNKRFHSGDILVFSYVPRYDSVVAVDKWGYDNCTWPAKGKTYDSGLDKIVLRKGPNYFVSGYWGRCYNGEKIAAIAA